MPPLTAALHSIEWQLCMRCLPAREILQLTLCCKSTLTAASDAFPWRNCDPLPVDTNHAPSRLTSLCGRFCPLHLRWRPSRPFSDRGWPEDAAALLSLPLSHVRHLDASAFMHISADVWLQVLQSPKLAGLQQLTLHGGGRAVMPDVSMQLLPAILRLRRLRSLTAGRLDQGQADACLRFPPTLTSLAIGMQGPSLASILPLLEGCALRHLSLSHFQGTASELHDVLISSSLRSLESLRLNRAMFRNVEVVSSSPLLALTALRVLHFDWCISLDVLLPAIAQATQLHELILEPGAKHRNGLFAAAGLIPGVVDLMKRAPQVRCTLVLISSADLSFNKALRSFAEPLEKQFGSRVQMQMAEPRAQRRQQGPLDVDREALPRPGFGLHAMRRRPLQPDASSRLMRLPTVLQQLLFQYLSGDERIRLARSCRGLYSAADSAVVWRHARIKIRQEQLFASPEHTAFSLSRRFPLSLSVVGSVYLSCDGKLVRALSRRPHLNLMEFNTLGSALGSYPAQATRILSRPAMQRLRAVRLQQAVTGDILTTLSLLPDLELLHVVHLIWVDEMQGTFAELGRRSRLHTLCLGEESMPGRLQYLAPITSLRLLQLAFGMLNLDQKSPAAVADCLRTMPQLRCDIVALRSVQHSFSYLMCAAPSWIDEIPADIRSRVEFKDAWAERVDAPRDYDDSSLAFPSTDYKPSPSPYDVLRMQGNELFKAAKFAPAIEIYSKCIALDASRWEALSNRGQAYLRQRKWKLALGDADAALKLSPQNEKCLCTHSVASAHLFSESAVGSADRLHYSRLQRASLRGGGHRHWVEQIALPGKGIGWRAKRDIPVCAAIMHDEPIRGAPHAIDAELKSEHLIAAVQYLLSQPQLLSSLSSGNNAARAKDLPRPADLACSDAVWLDAAAKALNNCFRPMDASGVRCSYNYRPLATLINHSCWPNVALRDDWIVALAPIRAGHELGNSYLPHTFVPPAVRRQMLSHTWGFDCTCARCSGRTAVNADAALMDGDAELPAKLRDRLHAELAELASTTFTSQAAVSAWLVRAESLLNSPYVGPYHWLKAQLTLELERVWSRVELWAQHAQAMDVLTKVIHIHAELLPTLDDAKRGAFREYVRMARKTKSEAQARADVMELDPAYALLMEDDAVNSSSSN